MDSLYKSILKNYSIKLADTTNTAYLCIWNPTRAEGYARPGEASPAPWHFAPCGLGQSIREENRQY